MKGSYIGGKVEMQIEPGTGRKSKESKLGDKGGERQVGSKASSRKKNPVAASFPSPTGLSSSSSGSSFRPTQTGL